jgi:hypothetical protein
LGDRLQVGLSVQARTDLTIRSRRGVSLVDAGNDVPVFTALGGFAIALNLRRNRTRGLQVKDALGKLASPGATRLPDRAIFGHDTVDAVPLSITHTRGARGARWNGELFAVAGFAAPWRARVRRAAGGWIRALDAVRGFAVRLVVVDAEDEATSDDRAGKE